MKPTREQVLAEPAGRQMDAWVAEWVMKLSYILFDGYDRDAEELTPCYSDDIAAAWEVVERIRPMFWSVQIIVWDHSDKYLVSCIYRGGHDEPERSINTDADTAPLAICRAALLTVLEDA